MPCFVCNIPMVKVAPTQLTFAAGNVENHSVCRKCRTQIQNKLISYPKIIGVKYAPEDVSWIDPEYVESIPILAPKPRSAYAEENMRAFLDTHQ